MSRIGLVGGWTPRARVLMYARVNLLLLLSALLSALTGAGAQARAPQQVVAVAQSTQAETARRFAPEPQTRPTAALPTLPAVAVIDGLGWPLSPAAPLFLSRRRE